MLIWREQMSIANDILDSEHRYLLCLINSVELACRTNHPDEAISTILAQLTEYVGSHFEREERMQLTMGYPQHAAHSGKHEKLRAQLAGVVREFEGLAEAPNRDSHIDHLVELNRHWLVDHILRDDMQMKPYLRRRPATFSA
jgi:hemerythrin